MAGTTRSTGMHMEEELGMGMGMGMESMMCGDLFDQIEDLLDFPNDTDAEMMVDPSCNIDGLHCNIDGLPFPAVDQDELLLVPPPLQVESNGDFLPNQQSEINLSPPVDNTFNEEDDKVYENLEISDMDWFSNFIYDTADSFSLSFPADHISNNNSNNNMSIKEDSMFRTSSPVSVLEPNNSGAGGNGSSASSSSSSFSSSASTKKNVANNARTLSLPSNPLESAVPARSRNKRPRTTTFSPRPHVSISFLPPSPDSAPESFGESLASPMMFKKKKKATMLTEAPDCGTSISARKCTHCQIQKTPQWRAGPLGPKTLCNACGVRYKSGRLFPEYRPAASPTFIPAVHSNSHKKVVEIRLKTTTVPSREMSCDLLEYIRRRE